MAYYTQLDEIITIESYRPNALKFRFARLSFKFICDGYNPKWPEYYEAEISYIKELLAALLFQTCAKPIIDILVGVQNIQFGYEYLGEAGISN